MATAASVVVRMAADTAEFTSKIKSVQADINRLNAHLKSIADTKTSLASVNKELTYQLDMLNAVGKTGTAVNNSIRREYLEQAKALKQQRAELIEILELDRQRAKNQAAAQSRYMANLQSSIASAAAFEASAAAISTSGGATAGGGIAGMIANVRQFSTLVKGGGVLLGITQLTNVIRGLNNELASLGDNATDIERAWSITKRIPGIGLFAEGASLLGLASDIENMPAERAKAAARIQEQNARLASASNYMEAQAIEYANEKRLIGLEGYKREVELIKIANEAKMEAIRINKDLFPDQKNELYAAEAESLALQLEDAQQRENDRRAEIARTVRQEQKEADQKVIDALESLEEAADKWVNELMHGQEWAFEDRRDKAIKNQERTNAAFEAKQFEERVKRGKEAEKDAIEKRIRDADKRSSDLSSFIAKAENRSAPSAALVGSGAAHNLIAQNIFRDQQKPQIDILKKQLKQQEQIAQSSKMLLEEFKNSGAEVD